MASLFPDGDFYFLQDNAPVHSSRVTKEGLSQMGLKVFDWPARSPDLNPIENYWQALSGEVYKKGAYNSDSELWEEILKAAQKVKINKPNLLKTSCCSMNRRLLKVIESKGDSINY